MRAGRPALVQRAPEASGFSAVLGRRDFRLLWAAQLASQLADKFLMFTLLLVVYDLSRHSTLQSLLMLAYTFPSVVLSAPAGVFVDRADKRKLMLATNVLRAALILLIPAAQAVPALRGQAWPLLLITLAFSSVGQLFAPAEAASIPMLVRPRQIMSATSLFMTTLVVTLVVGVPSATLAFRLLGSMAPFYIAALLFVIAAVCVAALRTPLTAAAAGRTEERHLARELREGIALLGGNPALRVALAQLTVALAVVFTVFALGPAYMATILHRPSADTYLVLIPATVGLVGAAVVLGQSSRRIPRARTLVTATLIGGVTLVGIGLVPGGLQDTHHQNLLVPAALVLSTAFGCALGGLLIPAFTVLQERTTAASRGRIFGGIFTVINAAVAAPLLLAGGLADAFGVDRVIAGLGAVLGVCGLAACTVLRKQISVLDEPQTRVR
ncbi:MAG: MFS transporter [Candidatus Dormibacteria bacterium]